MEGGGGRQEGITLGSVLGKEKDRSLRVNRTLLDIIRQEEPNCRVYENIIDSQNKKGWKFFKEKHHLKRRSDGDVWAARVPVPLSDVLFRDHMVSSSSNAMAVGAGSESNQRLPLAQLLRGQSAHFVEQLQEDDYSGEVPWAATGEVQSLNQYLSRVGPSRENDLDYETSLHTEHVPIAVAAVNSRGSMLTRNTSHVTSAEQPDVPVSSVRLSEALAAEREHMQAVVSSTEAARSAQDEAEVTETNNRDEERVQIAEEITNEQPQVRMSLMDLLEETDGRQLGWSSYSGEVYDHTGNIDEGNEYVEEEGSNFVEQTCCVCMVRHKGSAFIPCGHTFCRLCSRELWVNRGNCPICNGFILEILDIF